MITINITKKTFEKKLVQLGYNYKIKQFENLIDSIRKRIVLEINESTNKKETLNYIFKSHLNAPFLILEDNSLITKISKRYLTELIENSLLDLYFEEKTIIFTKKEQEDAYILKELGSLERGNNNISKNKYIVKNYPFLSSRQTSYQIKLRKCINSKAIILDKIEKYELIKKYNIYMEERENFIKKRRFRDNSSFYGWLNVLT